MLAMCRPVPCSSARASRKHFRCALLRSVSYPLSLHVAVGGAYWFTFAAAAGLNPIWSVNASAILSRLFKP